MGKIEIDHVPPQKFSRIGASIVDKSSHQSSFNNFTMKNDEKNVMAMSKLLKIHCHYSLIHFASTSNTQRGSESFENISLISTFFLFRYPQRKFEFSNQETHKERKKKPNRKSFNLLSAMKQTTRCVPYEASIRLKASKIHWRNV